MYLPISLPVSRIEPAMEAPILRWGIMGSGGIAERFIESVRAHTRQEIVAVGSRNKERAEEFASRTGVEQAMATLDMIRHSIGIDFSAAGLLE